MMLQEQWVPWLELNSIEFYPNNILTGKPAIELEP
jgi:hypothetical protein